MIIPGYHLANDDTPFDTTLPAGSFTSLHLNRKQLAGIRAAYPDALILVRHYLENWFIAEPKKVARDIAAWYGEIKHLTRHITYANEQNLSTEGHPYSDLYPPPELYSKIAGWNLATLKELRVLCPDATIHFPALSQGHSDDQNDAGYVGFEVLRKCVEAHDYLDVHTYWNGAQNRADPYYGRRYEKIHTLFPWMRLFASECNSDVAMRNDDGDDIARWYAELPDYIEGATLFIWHSYDNQKAWIVKDRPHVLNALRNFKLPLPQPAVTVARDRPKLIALIRAFEKFSPTWYPDGKGHKSIGYGHQGLPIEIQQWTAPMQRWQAVDVLNRDLQYYIDAVESRVKVSLNSNQWVALVSLCYNIGANAFAASDLLAKLNAGQKCDDEFARWVHSGPTVLPGLVERRAVERTLFES